MRFAPPPPPPSLIGGVVGSLQKAHERSSLALSLFLSLSLSKDLFITYITENCRFTWISILSAIHISKAYKAFQCSALTLAKGGIVPTIRRIAVSKTPLQLQRPLQYTSPPLFKANRRPHVHCNSELHVLCMLSNF